ncbi:hypothetical protein V5O48_019196, partial [Marasmius crinis-equi]
ENRPPPQQSYSRAGTPTFGGLLAPPQMNVGLSVPSEHAPGQNQNSIALRAMRSMRSLARIGSWAQLKNGSGPGEAPVSAKEVEPKEKKEKEDGKKKGTKKKKEKGEKEKERKVKEKEKAKPVRSSSSSFEIGTASPRADGKQSLGKKNSFEIGTASPRADGKQSLGKKKRSILGLGLPSTMRLPNVRSGSTTSSISANGNAATISSNNNNNRLSVESAVLLASRGRSGSTATSIMSSGSSLRPMSTTSSTNSRESSGSSAASVKWDEEGLETVKEQRRKEKASRRRSEESEKQSKRKSDRESRRASEERKRTPISDVFPEVYGTSDSGDSPARRTSVSSTGRVPLVTLEEATSDGHGRSDDDRSIETPSKRARPRPISEQLLKSRPRAIHEDDGDGVLSILSAATNDLEKLINHLDLEATPGATPGTPESFHWRPPRQEEPVPKLPCEDSPTKKTLRKDITSISSLRPYAQARTNNAA